MLQFAFHVTAHLMGWETINARCTFLSGSKCSCSSKLCAPASCFIKITYGFHLPLMGLTSALPYSLSGKLRPVAPLNSSKELWETRALSQPGFPWSAMEVLCREVLDLKERAELNLILLHQLYVDKRKQKRCFELSIALSHILVIHCCKLALEELLCDNFDNRLSNTANLG